MPFQIQKAEGGAVVKDIPNKLENPIVIVAHPDFVRRRNRDSAHKVMVLVDFVHNGRSVIAPIEVDAEQNVRNLKMDVNHVATYFDKKNISDILKEALVLESQGKTGFYFADIKRVAALLKGQGYQLPKSLRTHNSNIIIRKINTNVNRKTDTALKSHQFLKWFGEWLNNSAYASKIVNDDGTPKVVYHGSYSGFTVFGEGNKHSQVPDGAYFFTDDESVAYSYTGYKNEVDLSEADSGGWFPGGI